MYFYKESAGLLMVDIGPTIKRRTPEHCVF